jgi:mono/diheme cytochrome c family protein
MRCLLARLLAIGTGLLIVGTSLLFARLQNPGAAPGRAVYEREGCAMCHSIGGQGSPRHPLDGVGSRLSREDIGRWIVAPQEMDPKVRKKAYRLSKEDLDALVDYLVGL